MDRECLPVPNLFHFKTVAAQGFEGKMEQVEQVEQVTGAVRNFFFYPLKKSPSSR